MEEQENTGLPGKIRWKLLVRIEAVLIVLWVILRNIPALEEAGAGGSVNLLFVALVALSLVFWLVLASGLAWKNRLIGVLGVVLLFVLVKMDGHTGSFFPQFSFRWTKKAATEIPELTGQVAREGTVLETSGPENFPRFLGEAMNNRVSGEGLPSGWFGSAPAEVWRRTTGEGWSSFSVAGGYAFTMEQRGEYEITLSYELETGNPVWVHQEKVRFEESMGDDGPRSTPTIFGGKVFSLGSTGILNCLDARTGESIWRKNVLEEAGQSVPQWAKSCSPLIVDDKVVVTLGSEAKENLAAYALSSGKLVWRSGDYPSSYASPVVAELAGKRQIVALQQKSVDGYDIETGSILWSFPIGNKQGNCASPQVVGDTVITSCGYGYGTHRIRIEKTAGGFEASEMWHSRKLKSKFADFVVHEGCVYGLNDGRMVCLDLEDGSMKWRGTNFGHGQLLGIGGHAVVQHETGEISILELSSSEEKVVNEFEALEHRTWNHPVLAGRFLLVRNDREAIAFKF